MISLITAAELGEYTGNVTTTQAALRQTFTAAASEIISSFLGYDPNAKERDEYFDGYGGISLALSAKPVTLISVVSFRDNGIWTNQDIPKFFLRENYLYLAQGKFPDGEATIRVVFTGGYSSSDIPGVMKMTALRIAGVLAAEGDGNIGITSKSFGETGSRVFLNSKFDRYLEALEEYRINRI
jgi:hypothetical protein